MRLNESPQIGDGAMMRIRVTELFREVARKVNLLAAGTFAAVDNTATAAPSTGTWAQNDFVANSNRTEAGTTGSKYVILGWVCVAGGTPGTWVQCRVLTGN